MNKKYFLWLLFITAFLSCSRKDNVQPAANPTKPVVPVTPAKPHVYHQDGDVKQLLFNDPNGVNIVILGDAFIKDDLDTGGYYDQQVKNITDYLFTVPPFAQNKQHFNIYVVYAQSQQRGAAIGYNQGNTNTRFNAYFDTQITRLLLIGNTDAADQYVEKAVPLDKAHLVLVLVNDPNYGGSGGYLTTASTDPNSKYVMIHEIGHSFGGLTDEYTDDQEAAMTTTATAALYPNTDTTNDPLKIKWAHFLNQSPYTGIVGAYQGGYYRATGVYRPEQGSIMYDFTHLNYNAPSREAIERKIDTITGIPFNFKDFLKRDSAYAQPVIAGGSGPGPVNLHPIKNDFIGGMDRMHWMKKNRKQKL